MAFAIGPAVQSLHGYGLAIRDEKGTLVFFIEYESRAEAERAEADMKRGISGATRIRNARGEEW
jgi:hypothetical protein